MKLETWKSTYETSLFKVVFVILLLLIPIVSYAAIANNARVQNMEIASIGSGGVLGDGGSFFVYTSADGRYVTYESLADNWIEGTDVKPNWVDIYIRDRVDDKIVKASVRYDGGPTNESSYDPTMTADGRYVAYFSYASDIVHNDTNGTEWSRDGLDVFLFDTNTGKNQRVSLTSSGKQITGNSVGGISPDGQFILFISDGVVINDAPADKVRSALYLRDWQSGAIERISRATDGGYPNATPLDTSISWDNRYIVYSSEASNLVGDDSNGHMDIFLYDRQAGTTTLISRDPSGRPANGRSSQPKISYDGQTVVFRSYADNLVSDDTNGEADIFLYDVSDGKIRRINLAGNGAQANGMSRDASICSDGRFISYTTEANNLTPGDNNNERDVILYDSIKGTNAVVTINQDAVYGNGRAHRSFVAPDCRVVSFASDASNLVPGDINDHRDIFLADIYVPADFSDSDVSVKGTAEPGETITYTFRLRNSGFVSSTAMLISQVPTNTTYVVGSATNGAVFDDVEKQLTWQLPLAGSYDVEISYSVVVDPALTEATALYSSTMLSGDGETHLLAAHTLVNSYQTHLVLIRTK